MSSLFKHYPARPNNDACQNSYLILGRAHDAASSFLDTFATVRRARGARGTPTDEEQDLLRAMLVFSTAGLDSMVKQLVTDALPTVIDTQIGAAEIFKKQLEKWIRKGDLIDHRLLADVLGDKAPRQQLLNLLVRDLTAGSLQSKDQLARAASFFDIPTKSIIRDMDRLSKIFKARNEISHEMDIDFDQTNRNRRPRAKQKMIDNTNEIFNVSNKFLLEVEARL